ncbi:MAG TPA: hypothetical protein VJ697_11375 [Nitrososphaeraceae archaeon]|nr:hypothetical protein [Nitrososphaeraceae archaeon]
MQEKNQENDNIINVKLQEKDEEIQSIRKELCYIRKIANQIWSSP